MRFVSALLATLALPSTAHACGGFFCNTTPSVPGGPVEVVDQAGEDVLFYKDAEAGTVTMHIQVAFEGEASDFAWIIPVMGNPTVELSTEAIFPILRELRAQYQVDPDTSACTLGYYGTGTGTGAGTGTGTGTGTGGGSVPGVQVVSTGAVGAYETVVLQATSSTDLVDWLITNNFELPPGLDPLLAPYISPDTYFLALRLQKGSDVGDLQPIALTYPGDMPAIPIQLTSVAATPDMTLRVYLLGEHRAVPLSYLHVQLNPLAVDYWNGGDNLEDVITAAADEAGGHAFFTDYSGPTAPVQNRVHQPAWDLVQLDTISDAETLITTVATELPLDDRMQEVLSDHLGLPVEDDPAALDLPEVVDCLTASPVSPAGCWSYELSQIQFDPIALADDVETLVLEPRRRLEEQLALAPKITRLASSISPSEMTVDPTFGFNADMPDVPLLRTMDETYLCAGGSVTTADRRLDAGIGLPVFLPPLSTIGFSSPSAWLEVNGYADHAALIVEQTTEQGLPNVLVDNTDAIFADPVGDDFVDDLPADDAFSCGCEPTSPAAAWIILFPLLFGLRPPRRD